MTIEWLRDLVIVIYGLGATVVVLALLVMGIMLFVRVKAILDSAKEVSKTVEDISHCVEQEVVRPLAQVASIVQGIRQAAGMFGGFGRNKEDKSHGGKR